MRIFLTGATGFVGSYVLEHLLKVESHEVAILHRPASRHWRIEQLLDQVTLLDGDLLNVNSWQKSLCEFRPQAVLHLAWAGVMNTARNDLLQLENIASSHALIQASARAGATHWIGLGSQAEYGPCANRTSENTPTRPTTLYGASKLSVATTGERLCELLGLRFAWLRLFSSYGPKDHASWMIPSVIGALCRGERPAATAGEQRWDYIHVEDVAAAIYQTLVTTGASGVFNLGSGTSATIRSVMERIRDLVDPALQIGFGDIPYREDQVMHLEADISRLATVTGWHPQVPLDEGLAQTVEWYRECSYC